jgi:hypothetical protein
MGAERHQGSLGARQTRDRRKELKMKKEMKHEVNQGVIRATVHVPLSDAGQRDAIRRGYSGEASRTVRGDIHLDHLDRPYTRVLPDGEVVVGSEDGFRGHADELSYDGSLKTHTGRMTTLPESPEEAALWWMDRTIEEAKRIAEHDLRLADEQRAREDDLCERISVEGLRAGIARAYQGGHWVDVVHSDVPEELRPLVEDEIDKVRREKEAARDLVEAERLEKEAARAAEKQARDEHVLSYVREQGTLSQRERLERGLLPLSEAYDACRDSVFAPYDGYPRYERMTDDEVCDYEGQEVNYETTVPSSVAEWQWDVMRPIWDVDPNASVTFRIHIASSDEGELARRYGILVERTDGPVRFSREFACNVPE